MTLNEYRTIALKLNNLYRINFHIVWGRHDHIMILSGFGQDIGPLLVAEKLVLKNGFTYDGKKTQEFNYVTGRTYTTFKFKTVEDIAKLKKAGVI